jgi:hypothetical protein
MTTVQLPDTIAAVIFQTGPGLGLRVPVVGGAPGAAVRECVWVPDLTAAEQVILDDLTTMARFGVTMTLAEWQGIKADAAGLKSYLGVGSPTAAQTAAATKAIIRVLATIIRS